MLSHDSASGTPGGSANLDSVYWDNVARRVEKKYYLPEIVAELRREVCFDLLQRWCGPALHRQRILKTDTFEEAFARTTFLLELARTNPNLTGVDISPVIVDKAREKAHDRDLPCRFVAGDVRSLPFCDEEFDVVFSHSTLDHFPRESDMMLSLEELQRVLRPGGQLVLILDNKDNLCDPLVKLASRTVSPFFVGKSYSVEEVAERFTHLSSLRYADSAYIANSPRIVDIAMIKMLNLFGSQSVDQLTKKAVFGMNTLLQSKRPISRLFGTYVAVKAVKR